MDLSESGFLAVDFDDKYGPNRKKSSRATSGHSTGVQHAMKLSNITKWWQDWPTGIRKKKIIVKYDFVQMESEAKASCMFD